MATAPRDPNRIPTLIGVDSSDITVPAIVAVDTATNRMLVNALISETAPATIVAFVTDIPNAGTRVQLAANTIAAGVIQAPSTNTGNIFVGGSNVSSSVFGAELQPGQSTGIAIDNTNDIWVDVATNGDDVSFLGS